MILCDRVDVGEGAEAAITFTSVASRELELSIAKILKTARAANNLTVSKPGDIYKTLALVRTKHMNLDL